MLLLAQPCLSGFGYFLGRTVREDSGRSGPVQRDFDNRNTFRWWPPEDNRHVCDALGLKWVAQFEKIKEDAVLNSTIRLIRTVAHDGKNRETTMLPIEFLSGWLFTIKKVRPELQAKLNLYRAEGFRALDAWFSCCRNGNDCP